MNREQLTEHLKSTLAAYVTVFLIGITLGLLIAAYLIKDVTVFESLEVKGQPLNHSTKEEIKTNEHAH